MPRKPAAMALLGLDTMPKKVIFVSYMALWCGLRLFVYASKNSKGAPRYNSTSLLLVVCFAKLLMAVAMFIKSDGNASDLCKKLQENRGLFLRYTLPAAAYVLYDNLTFVNLTFFDPVTYSILMQIRLVITGLMWSAMFSKKLAPVAWAGLGLITLGCVVKESQRFFDTRAAETVEASLNSWTLGLLCIALQVLAGVFASVFNETLLKKQALLGVNLQNVCMYVHSIVANAAVLALRGELGQALQPHNLSPILLSLYICPIALIMASIGIVTSLFLKHLDSVRKSIASALEIFVDALLTWLVFGIPVSLATFAAIVMVSGGIYLYSRPSEPAPEPGCADVGLEQVVSPAALGHRDGTAKA
eukprot:GGOE01001474.1.p1 GENE.GGOE01001474.1~~GGOE01001474.1.p1  ORF type:complete len:360 (-),score=103.92 GGOE01001474.1:397-1476(-)